MSDGEMFCQLGCVSTFSLHRANTSFTNTSLNVCFPWLLAVQEKYHAIFCSVLLPGWAWMVGLYFADNIYSFSLHEKCLRRKGWDMFAPACRDCNGEVECCILLCPTLPKHFIHILCTQKTLSLHYLNLIYYNFNYHNVAILAQVIFKTRHFSD